MKVFITILEWAIGYLGVCMTVCTLVLAMFTDVPSSMDKLTSLQKIVFDIQGLVILLLVLGLIISFIGQFVFKQVPWRHIVLGIGVVGIVYSLIFFGYTPS